jgi:hypothetical protein
MLLLMLSRQPRTFPFEKHLAGESSPYELLRLGSWTSGDEAAQAGFDLRLFYQVEFSSGGCHADQLAACQSSLSGGHVFTSFTVVIVLK